MNTRRFTAWLVFLGRRHVGHGVHQVLAAKQGPLLAPTPLTLATRNATGICAAPGRCNPPPAPR